MKTTRMLYVMALLGIVCFALLAPARAADDPPIEQYLIASAGSCGTTGADISGTADVNYREEAVLTLTVYFDGVPFYTGDSNVTVQQWVGGWYLGWFPGGPFTYPYTFEWEWLYKVDGEAVWRNTAGFTCDGGTPTGYYTTFTNLVPEEVVEVQAAPVPGPDLVAIPDDAVVGTFVEAATLHYLPQADALTDQVMAPGKTLWVFGLDPSGDFYQVLLSGQTYWVPRDSLGPTYDAPWFGAPLPQ